MSDDPIGDQIKHIDEQIKALTDERDRLQRKHGYPHVIPVIHYWRRFTKYEEPADVCNFADRSPLEQAYGQLWGGLDNGDLSPEGVSINGVFFSYGSLDKRFQYQ